MSVDIIKATPLDNQPFKVTVEERISNKTGKPYKCLSVSRNGLEKIIFLTQAEYLLFTQDR